MKRKKYNVKSPEERFWLKVQKTDYCWNWKECPDKGGYGHFRLNDKFVMAHRFSYELFKGKISQGLTIDHLCRNPLCVNPEHLEVVTMKENILRGTSFSAINARKTHCPQGHEYNESNTYINNSQRYCRICKKYTNSKYRALHLEILKV